MNIDFGSDTKISQRARRHVYTVYTEIQSENLEIAPTAVLINGH